MAVEDEKRLAREKLVELAFMLLFCIAVTSCTHSERATALYVAKWGTAAFEVASHTVSTALYPAPYALLQRC